MPTTHEVTNQPPPPFGHDVADDPALLAAVEWERAGWRLQGLHELVWSQVDAGLTPDRVLTVPTRSDRRLLRLHPGARRRDERRPRRLTCRGVPARSTPG